MINSIRGVPGDLHAPASNTAAIVTYASAQAQAHCISGVVWSYDGTPTGGSCKVEDGAGTIIRQWDITAGGPGFMPFDGYDTKGLKGGIGTAMVITLAAGGNGVTGKVQAKTHWTE